MKITISIRDAYNFSYIIDDQKTETRSENPVTPIDVLNMVIEELNDTK